MMEKVTINADLLLQLNSIEEWVNKIPRHLPVKQYPKEEFLWLDKNGNQLIVGEDFQAAKEQNSFPVSIYRLQRVSKVKDVTNV